MKKKKFLNRVDAYFFLLLISLVVNAWQIDWVKEAWADVGTFIFGRSNYAGTSATELHSTNSVNTLKVISGKDGVGTGHALHAVNSGNDGDAVHAWAGSNAGNGVYGETLATSGDANGDLAGVTGVADNAPGVRAHSVNKAGIVTESDTGFGLKAYAYGSYPAAYFNSSGGHGAIVIGTNNSRDSCLPGALKVESVGDSHKLMLCVGSSSGGIWRALQMEDVIVK